MNMINEDKDKIAIVVVGYNRIDSIRRLLDSLQRAEYPTKDIPLVISIDCSGDEVLYDYVKKYEWNHGPKYVIIQEKRLGLKNHIIKCGDLTQFFKAIVLLEDDIFVSEVFYRYVSSAVEFYYNEPRIGGISLYQNEVMNCYGGTIPVTFSNDGSDTYLKQTPASWGECWTDKQWLLFKEWYAKFDDSRFVDIDMPENIKTWKKAWSKYYIAYLIDTDRFFVFPYLSHTTCFGDAGEHSSESSTVGQANLFCGQKNYVFKPFEEMTQYSIYLVNKDIYSWIGIPESDLCVDWYCTSKNIRKCRYLLTTAELPFNIVKKYGLIMSPLELNIKYNTSGNDIFLYDTIDGNGNTLGHRMPSSMTFYYLRSFSIYFAITFVISHYKNAIKRRLLKRK